MSKPILKERTRAQESTNAIERLYISMRHLFSRGFYKPMGVSGETLRKSLLSLRPEIYGSIAENKTELNGLVYVIERLPEGIEECQFIYLTADEGYRNSKFKAIVPPKRRRNCYRIDKDQMNIEITRGRSEIYDILTHLTFLFIESHKIKDRVVFNNGESFIREWLLLEDIVIHNKTLTDEEKDVIVVHLGNILGRTYDEVYDAYNTFSTKENPNRFFHLIYWLGKLAINETLYDQKRSIKFSSVLTQEIGHHYYGEMWANNIKKVLLDNELIERPIHIISANMHSVMNSIYAQNALPKEAKKHKDFQLFEVLSNANSSTLQSAVKNYASENGLIYIKDTSGTNINVQVIDTQKINFETNSFNKVNSIGKDPVIIVMDYAFGEQAFETMDELLKPYKTKGEKIHLDVQSVSIMGKAGILEGGKGDIMIPSSHIFEGTADNYPFKNELSKEDLEGFGVQVFDGAMITVLGTSLQNKDLLRFFHDSTWDVIGLEMEGAHYQKAIQSASKIRGNISENVKVRYAYYASDNPLETGATLASGGLGMSGVTPTYAITQKILEQIF
ncbi:hypothetical protein HER15_09940 [Tenacibaculum mesophilum]|uniref:Uncharacterized protein n=1 Tax=Tenacibaculum mesophilum TaxID=104268 RepID=A0AAE9MNW8_9FLAO|nr:hypothetical protein [Tenacibaculum mesophilum]UTD15771.1 hypothetical protein HER15_09940 [Tenacibaculum mesophilum]BFF39348.1 hypothetical protein BACY1_11530 [Tenacibaculum mesophilum]GFD71762.1 hypothetical protein KUL113_11820 [Tenacibaculum sp. KUL113]GFD78689.1 hypothetical protein KUL118_15510 [Tenacibaculum sp. KUL118]